MVSRYEQLNRLEESCKKFDTILGREIDGNIGEKQAFRSLEALKNPYIMFRNLEINDGDRKFFSGKENEVIEGKLHTLEEWKSDDEKLGFIQKFGWLLEDDASKAYSSKYKKEK